MTFSKCFARALRRPDRPLGVVHFLLLLGRRRRDQAQERVREQVRYVNGLPNLARIVELVVRVVRELVVGVRLLRVGPDHLIVDVLENGLLVLCEQLDEVRRERVIHVARFRLGGELADDLDDLGRFEQRRWLNHLPYAVTSGNTAVSLSL